MVLKIAQQAVWTDFLGALLLALLLLQMIRTVTAGRLWHPAPAALPLALLALLPLLQVVPLPTVMLHWLSPQAWEYYRQSIWVVQPKAWMPLSLDPTASLAAFFPGIAAWACYLLVVQLLTDRPRLEKAVLVLTAVAAGSALLALTLADQPGTLLLPAVLLPVTCALYLARRPKVEDTCWQERLRRWFRCPELNGQMLLLAAVAVLLLALGTAMSGAPGGWSVGLLVFALLLLSRRRLRRWGGYLLLPAVPLLVMDILPMGGKPFDSVAVWYDAWQVFTNFPVFGIGSGAQASMTAYHPLLLGDGRRPSLLAVGVGGGFAGLLLAAWAAGDWLRSTLAYWRRRHNVFAVCLYAGCLGGLLTALGRAVAPLPLLALLAGLAAAAALHSSRSSLTGTVSLSKLQAGSAMILLAVLLAGQLALPLMVKPERLPTSFRRLSLEFLTVDRQQTLIDEHLHQGDPHAALIHIAMALRLRPLHPSMQSQAAEILDRLGQEAAADKLWLSAAGATTDGSRRFAQRLWQRGSGEAAKGYLRRILASNPQRTGEFLPLLEFWGVGHDEMVSLLPEAPLAQVALGEFLAARSEQRLAARHFRQAVQLAGGIGGGPPEVFERAGEFFVVQGQHRDALEMVQSGLRHFPTRLPLRRLAGSLYEELGISYRAIEEYRQCLLLDPSDAWSRQRLALLTGE